MWAHVHASCCDHSWMLLHDAWPGFRRYHHASTGPRTCLVHRNPGTYVSILTAGSASPPAHSWCGINLHIHGVELLLRRVAGKLCLLCVCALCVHCVCVCVHCVCVLKKHGCLRLTAQRSPRKHSLQFLHQGITQPHVYRTSEPLFEATV